MKILVIGPYIGEFGWEVFSWQPMARNQWMIEQPDRTIVFAGTGREKLYRFADEVRQLDDMPKYDTECHGWHGMNPAMVEELKALINRAAQSVHNEVGDGNSIRMFSPLNIQLGNENLSGGQPDLLYNDWPSRLSQGQPDRKTVVLCIRDREMSNYRNWESINWYELAEQLVGKYNVLATGILRESWQWPIDVVDLTNQTSVDDMIGIFTNGCDLAVGGSTGTVHLASRCAVPHLTWGDPKNVIRYATTNWFATPFRMNEDWGWEPDPDDVAAEVTSWLEAGKWL